MSAPAQPKSRVNLIRPKASDKRRTAFRETGGLRVFFLLLTLVLVAWAASAWWLHSDPNRGTFGDMFGAVNSLFSGMAFAGLTYTVLLQRQELQLQRYEVGFSRNELREQHLQMIQQTKVLDLQTQLLTTQQFESTYFQLLGVLDRIAGSISVSNLDGGFTVGRLAFATLYATLQSYHSDHRLREPNQRPIIHVRRAYHQLWQAHGSELNQYFTTLNHTLSLIDRSSLNDKTFYADLLRVQLSEEELLLLFYFGVTDMGFETLRPQAQRFALFRNLPDGRLLSPDDRDMHSPSVFGHTDIGPLFD